MNLTYKMGATEMNKSNFYHHSYLQCCKCMGKQKPSRDTGRSGSVITSESDLVLPSETEDYLHFYRLQHMRASVTYVAQCLCRFCFVWQNLDPDKYFGISEKNSKCHGKEFCTLLKLMNQITGASIGGSLNGILMTNGMYLQINLIVIV